MLHNVAYYPMQINTESKITLSDLCPSTVRQEWQRQVSLPTEDGEGEGTRVIAIGQIEDLSLPHVGVESTLLRAGIDQSLAGKWAVIISGTTDEDGEDAGDAEEMHSVWDTEGEAAAAAKLAEHESD
jgi:hypothetical protein